MVRFKDFFIYHFIFFNLNCLDSLFKHLTNFKIIEMMGIIEISVEILIL